MPFIFHEKLFPYCAIFFSMKIDSLLNMLLSA
ncbi:hypothetical protein CIPAW_11G058800 [Carya illinoinensis]|uniref:Uncharacterized protein n=1 Tax=Carya illinoinensis TaxID=32201 RepID=A0A8T1P1N7_CARIL|nr:hypothetical protein CIPAW_11G058800 [Carya illinoinensis]